METSSWRGMTPGSVERRSGEESFRFPIAMERELSTLVGW